MGALKEVVLQLAEELAIQDGVPLRRMPQEVWIEYWQEAVEMFTAHGVNSFSHLGFE